MMENDENDEMMKSYIQMMKNDVAWETLFTVTL